MSDITISVIQPPSTTINVGVDETTLIQAGMGLPPHSVTHISGGSDELNHNLLAGLQGGSGGQYYHLSSGEYFNLVTGQVIRPDQTGLFYPNDNPSGYITGIDLSNYTTINYVTGVSGGLQTQITTLNNQTGSYYPRTNPSGFITGINNLVFTTGNQTISGAKTFTNNLVVGGNDLFVDTSSDRVGISTATPTATLDVNGSGIFRSGLNVTRNLNLTGTLNINAIGELYTPALTTNGPILVNDSYFDGLVWQARQDLNYVALSDYASNNYILVADYGIDVEAPTKYFQVNAPTRINYSLTGTTGIFLNSLTAPNLVYNTGNQIISGAKTFTGSFNVSTNDAIIIRSTGYTNGVEIGGGYFNKIADGGFVNDFGVGGTENHFGDSATSSNSFGGSAVQNDFGAYATLNNYYAGFGIGQFDFDTRPTVNGTGVLLEGEIPDTGYLSGYVNKNETGDFYPRTNPSGYISGINNLVFTTGNQTISGAKTFTNNLTVNGGDLFVDTSNNRVGIGTASPITTLDVNGSGLFRSGLNANLIISTGSPLNILGKDNATQAFPGNFLGGSINLNAGSGNFIPGSISLKGGAHPTVPGAISLNGGLTASNIPEGKISLNSKSIEVNKNNNYTSSTIFYKTGLPFESENINISQNSISINNNLLINGNRPTVNSTGILLSGEATTQDYVTGISGGLQTQIAILNNQTGSYYPRTNPSGYITGVDLSFSGNYYTKTESESRYVNTTGAETILGNKTFHDNVYINNLYVTGLETIVNTTNTNVASNYITLNLTGGAVDGGIFFVTGSGLTGINDSGAIIGFDHSDEFKFGISTRASDLSTLNTIASVEQMTGISGGLQTQISTLNNQTGSYVLNTQTGNFITTSQTGQFYASSNPSGFITGVDLSSYATQVYVTGISGDLQAQITDLNNSTGQFYLNSNPSGYITGVDLSTYATIDYVTGISGELQTQITDLVNATGSYVLNSQTGDFYANSNPSGFITGINDLVYTTGDQSISGNINISGNLTISGVYNIYQQIENAKILSIAYAIAL